MQPKGTTGSITTNAIASGTNGGATGGALTVVQRTPSSAFTLAGIDTVIGRTLAVIDVITGTRVACGIITVL